MALKPTWISPDGLAHLYLSDCREVLAGLPENSVHAAVTDPPYGLAFMGKDWDHGIPGVRFWQEALRVARPGAMLLAFGGTRTWHRLVCAIEDAGWEIRDTLCWLYGQGFPKSLDLSKAIDKAAGAEREVVGRGNGGLHHKATVTNLANWNTDHDADGHSVTAPATDAARLWAGWGTALKPAWEPIVLAMKPLDGRFAENARKWGVAGLNIRGCRLPTAEGLNGGAYSAGKQDDGEWGTMHRAVPGATYQQPPGRWPANVALDEAAAGMLDEQAGERPQGIAIRQRQSGCTFGAGGTRPPLPDLGYSDSGGASRFFYCAKAGRGEREAGLDDLPQRTTSLKYSGAEGFAGRTQLEDGTWTNTEKANRNQPRNHHPTVKPLALMRWLCRLVRPPAGGLILDPFLGSGSTLCAAALERMGGIGIEQDAAYLEIARRRIAHWQAQKDKESNAMPLFRQGNV